MTAADRQRRSRAHRKGDHSLCDADRCDPSTVTPVTRPQLGKRGRRLWDELTGDTAAPIQRVLIEEACRIADRLDRLDAQLRGDEDAWLRFVVNDDGSEVTVVIDKALPEARQQAVALKQLFAELRQSQVAAKPVPKPAVAPAEATPGVVVARGVGDLTARIRQRSAQTAG